MCEQSLASTKYLQKWKYTTPYESREMDLEIAGVDAGQQSLHRHVNDNAALSADNLHERSLARHGKVRTESRP